MVHPIGPRGSRGGMSALAGLAIGLSLVVGPAIEGGHTHDTHDSSAECGFCALPHQGAPASVSGPPVVVESGLLRAPAPPKDRLIPRVVHLSPRRSRAPPLSISS